MLIGICGKANVGKSTFFKAATLAEVEIANYPFATIKPNHGMGFIRVECADKDFNVQCNPRFGYCIEHTRFVPIDMLDVAGLVPGAHEGKGMGNQFLDDLRQADALIHVIDVAGTTNEKGESIDPGSYDPANDIRFLEEELDMWYLRLIKKGWGVFARKVKQESLEPDKALVSHLSGLGVTEVIIKTTRKNLELSEKLADWDDDTLKTLAVELRKVTKPMIIACNKIDVPGAVENFARLENEFPDHMLVACSAESELALREAAKHNLIKYVPGNSDFEVIAPEKLSEKQKTALEFIKTGMLKKFGSTGVQQVLDNAVLKLLKYIAVFPGGVNKLADQDGNILPDCFLMPKGTTAIDFAYRLHSDFGDNFIKAINVRTKLPVGKEHLLEHRDVIEIMANK
jgi:ribosome-binding ATPase YchF (GTP1/OBG family)|tara:strand:- start:297 stop:1493 length:1197 start_codon:yes stop_codon:yes gene_type:complete